MLNERKQHIIETNWCIEDGYFEWIKSRLDKKCFICGKTLINKQRKFCCIDHKNKHFNKKKTTNAYEAKINLCG